MKRFYLFLFAFSIFLLTKNETYSQCNITAYASHDTICLGDTVYLWSVGGCPQYALNNNFDLGNAGTGWTATTGVDFSNPCNPSANGTIYMWMGSSVPIPRTLTTVSFNMVAMNCSGGNICFDMKYATQSQSSPCEGPDMLDEGVSLQYSTNGGATWIDIAYFQPDGTILVSNTGNTGSAGLTSPYTTPFTSWDNFCFPIPAAAITTTTKFRWIQTDYSSQSNDHWGLDNVEIYCSAIGQTINWSHGPTTLSGGTQSPTTTTTYTVTVADGVGNSAVDSVRVVVLPIPPPPTASGTTINCGDSATLSASGSSTGYEWFSDIGCNNQIGSGTPFTTGPLSQDTTIYVRAATNGQCPSTATPVNITVIPINNPTATGTTVYCGDSATVTASGSIGDYEWYSDINGNNPIGTGSPFTLGPLTQDTTIYVAATNGTGSSSGSVYNFTNCAAIGSVGPTQAQVNTAYSGTILNSQITINTQGIQEWTVPQTGVYTIEAVGGQGYGTYGGRGAYMSGEFNLTAGTVLKIIVGQEAGAPVSSSNQYGGGGGSFVTYSTNTPLIVAGGGGGSWATAHTTTTDAPTTNNGNSGMNGPTNGAGGTAGSGGATASYADGGGGLLGDGGGTAGGSAFINGGEGGVDRGHGGFGGGGGTSSWDNRRGGGGGGYSGGGAAGSTTTGFPEGGGGGSYNDGTNQSNIAGFNTGNGYITITNLSSARCVSNLVPVQITVLPLADPIVNSPVSICMPDSVTLTASGSSGNYNWYDDLLGTNLVGTGANFTTPILNNSTTYYVQAYTGTGMTSQTYNFTNCGASGRFGPTQTQVNNAYAGTPLTGNVTINTQGIQEWTVPQTGTYTIITAGAQGGGSNGGEGASIQGEFNLNAGDVLKVLVGQQGTLNDNGGGGGGGSYVVLNGNPLSVAGGGGGNNGVANIACDGQSGQNAANGYGVTQSSNGGTAGNAGISTDRAQSGAGWNQNGAVLTQITTDTPAHSFVNDGVGGTHDTSPGGLGGFGGGGGSWNTGFRGSSGGGGYSGGGTGTQFANSNDHRGGGGGSYNTGTNQINQSGGNTGNGYVTISTTSTVSNCVSNLIPVVINAAPSPVITATANPTSICVGGSSVLTGNSNEPNTSYNWNSLGAGANHTVSPTTTTTYVVTGTTAAGCSAVDSVTVTVNPNLSPIITASADSICVGGNTNLTVSNIPTTSTFNWSTGDVTNPINVSPTVSTTYQVTVSDGSGCTGTADIDITVIPDPIITPSATALSICNGPSTTLNVTSNTIGTSFDWNQTLGAGNSHVVSPTTTTTYTVTGTTALGCTGTADITITVNPNPVITTSASVNPICLGNNTTITANSSVGGSSFNWNQGLGAGASHTVSPTVSTTYTVTGTSAAGCSGTDTITIQVLANLQPIITANPSTICENDSSSLTVTNVPATSTFNWSTGDITNPITVSPAATTTYQVTASDGSGCSGTTDVQLIVNPLPQITVTNDSVCNGDFGNIVASGGTSYIWDNGSTQNPLSDNPSQTTTYIVTGTDANGCSATAQGEILVVDPPTLQFVSSDAHCSQSDGSAEVIPSGGSGNYTYTWNTIPVVNTADIQNQAPGTYNVTVSDNGCEASGSVNIGNIPGPFAAFSINPTQAEINEIILFTDASIGAVLWDWDFGDGQFGSGIDPTHQYISQGSYDVWLYIEDDYGCKDSTSNRVLINSLFTFYIPNAFSPDGNAQNEVFLPQGVGVDEDRYLMQIFDRWGKKIFETTDIKEGWDGRIDGKDVRESERISEIFIYYIKVFEDGTDTAYEYRGTITLLK
jgi:gliding motility-associated-like protein